MHFHHFTLETLVRQRQEQLQREASQQRLADAVRSRQGRPGALPLSKLNGRPATATPRAQLASQAGC